MKRQPSQTSGSLKKVKSSQDDMEMSFEEVLMMMDESSPDGISAIDDGPLGESKWARSTAVDPQILNATVNLPMQWLDIDMTSSSTPMAHNPAGGKVLGSLEGPVPVIRLYGVTSDGHSVMCSVHGFTPYIYVALPIQTDLSLSVLSQLRNMLDQRVSYISHFRLCLITFFSY
jgi:DNA polymerase delta subunit 1